MLLVDARWVILVVAILAVGVWVALKPKYVQPVLVAVAVGTLLYVVLQLGVTTP